MVGGIGTMEHFAMLQNPRYPFVVAGLDGVIFSLKGSC